MPHDQQQKGTHNGKSGKEQKDMSKKGAGQEAQKGQTEQQRKDEANRVEQDR